LATYFGYTTEGSSSDYWDACHFINKNYITGFNCPGSGNQTVKELSAYVAVNNGGNIRLAIYDASHNLIYQGQQKWL